MTTIDRYIALICIGVFLISLGHMFTQFHQQKMITAQNRNMEYKKMRVGIKNIETWKKYHAEQIFIMQQILQEMKKDSHVVSHSPI